MTPPRTPHASVKGYVLSGLLALFALLAGFGVWATQARLSGAIIASGQVQSGPAPQIVQHPLGGRIDAVMVAEGDTVNAGDVLVQLDTAKARNALAFARVQLFDLAAQQGRLRAEYTDAAALVFAPDLRRWAAADPDMGALLEGQQVLFQATRETWAEQERQTHQRLAQIDAQLQGIGAQRVALNRQHDLVSDLLEKQNALLSRGLIPAAVVLETEREVSRLEGELALLVSRRAEAVERMAEVKSDLLARQAAARERAVAEAREMDETMRKYRSEAAMLETEIAQSTLRAPVSGIVHEMRLAIPEAVLRPAEPLLSIVPQNTEKMITAQIQPNDIDKVQVGQPVTLRLAVLDHRITPEITGRIARVSADAIEDDRRGTQHFEVIIRPEAGALAGLPAGAVLLPGMPVEVFVETQAQSPMRYLIKPVADYFAHAMREG